MRFDQLLDIGLQRLLRHAELAVWIKQLLVQEETVRAGQVAGGTAGLGKYVDAGWNGWIGHCPIIMRSYKDDKVDKKIYIDQPAYGVAGWF